jgi:hypothetical protein
VASEIRTMFRHCPACGRRFEIRLVSKKLLDENENLEKVPTVDMKGGPPSASVLGGYSPQGSPTIIGMQPIIIDVKDFQYTYRCRACGHTWMELRSDEETIGSIPRAAAEDLEN